jgi:acetolactate synthase-1/2/3 large subunit
MTAEELLASRFRDHGIRRFFGIPGGPSIPYMEAFRKAGIEFILTSHEASAAVMADVTARLTGITGICHATFGPGAVNLASGVGGALLDRSPLLALTTEMPDAWLGRTAQMNIDHQGLFKPVTKATFRLTGDNAEDIVSRSLAIANEEYPGPVHIGLPSDLAGTEAGLAADFSGATGTSAATGATGKNDADERARVLIASSRRPLIAVGLTAARAGAGPALIQFLEKCRVPVVVTPMAKGLIQSHHPCYAGVLFHALSDRLNRLIKEADLVIGLGYDPVEYNYEAWMPDVPLVHFDTRVTDLNMKGAIRSVSSPAGWFEMLSLLRSSSAMVDLAAKVHLDIRDGLSVAARGFNPVTTLTILKELLPDDAIVTADVGSHLHLLGQMWDVPASGKLIMTNGWSSMGFSLPAALAAALISRDAPVICITGDGGFLMHAGEIITARRYGLKVIVVVLSDGELNLIRLKQSWKNLGSYGTHVAHGSLFDARSFLGVEVIRVTDAKQMHSAVLKALRSDKSTIIEAAVDPAVYSDLVVRS